MSLTAFLGQMTKLNQRLGVIAAPQDTGDKPWAKFAGRPVEYAAKVLGITTLTPVQCDILESLHQAPYRVLVPSGHNVGKTFICGLAVNYWYDSFNPGAVFSLGPRHDSLKDTLWGEVRLQRSRAIMPLPDDFLGPASPEMRSSPDHWAKGLTALKDASLTGRHLPHMLFALEEACGIDPIFWTVVNTMFDASLSHAMLAIFNPTDSTSQAYQEDIGCDDADGEPRWHRIRLNAMEHPNIRAELEGRAKPVPHAVSVAMVNDWVADWCESVKAEDKVSTDVEWPFGSSQWHRPGPEFQARVQGLWPDSGGGVWSPSLWEAIRDRVLPYNVGRLPEIGCDCATGKGEDFHAIHAQWSGCSVHHETANTMDPARIYDRLREVAAMMAALVNRHRPPQARPISPKEILIKIDDDGTGGAVTAFLRGDGYNATGVSAGGNASDRQRYPNRRSELWFQTAAKAKAGLIGLGSLIGRKDKARLRRQLLAPEWNPNAACQRVVEKKEDTKDKLGRSPDDADAFNLAHLDVGSGGIVVVTERAVPVARPEDRPSQAQREQRRPVSRNPWQH